MLYDFKNNENYSDYRWTLDTPEDFNFIEAVYLGLYREGQIVSTDQVISLLKSRPELCKLNADVEQKKVE